MGEIYVPVTVSNPRTGTRSEPIVALVVIFGEQGDAAVLGLTVLELLGLVVDPVDQRLVPKDYLLYRLT